MITLLSSRGFTEGGPCYVVFCHSDRVISTQSNRFCAACPGSQAMPTGLLHPWSLFMPLPAPSENLTRRCRAISVGISSYGLNISGLVDKLGGLKSKFSVLGLDSFSYVWTSSTVWAIWGDLSSSLQKGMGLTEVLWNIYQLCRDLSDTVVRGTKVFNYASAHQALNIQFANWKCIFHFLHIQFYRIAMKRLWCSWRESNCLSGCLNAPCHCSGPGSKHRKCLSFQPPACVGAGMSWMSAIVVALL